MRILEINHLRHLVVRFPNETEHIDTSFTFTETKGLTAKLRLAGGTFARLWRLTRHEKFDHVFCRSMGRFIYRRNTSPLTNALRFLMGWCICLCVGKQVRRGARLAVVDSGDESPLDPRDLFLLRRCERYFKRELPQNAWNVLARLQGEHRDLYELFQTPELQPLPAKFEPLSLGISLERCRQIEETLGRPPAIEEKRCDVFFSGLTIHSTVRMSGQLQLERLRSRGYRIEFHTDRLPYDQFLERVRAAWLVWSPEGGGWDCYRHYEVPVAGAVPLVNHATIRRHAPLLHGVHCVEYAIEGDDLCSQVEAALADKEKLWQMTLAARAHVLRHHTHAALGEYMLNTLAGEGTAAVLPSAVRGNPAFTVFS